MSTLTATIILGRTETGRFRAELAELPGSAVEADTLEELLGSFAAVIKAEFRINAEPAGGPEADFDADLAYVLENHAELYRRLAR